MSDFHNFFYKSDLTPKVSFEVWHKQKYGEPAKTEAWSGAIEATLGGAIRPRTAREVGRDNGKLRRYEEYLKRQGEYEREVEREVTERMVGVLTASGQAFYRTRLKKCIRTKTPYPTWEQFVSLLGVDESIPEMQSLKKDWEQILIDKESYEGKVF